MPSELEYPLMERDEELEWRLNPVDSHYEPHNEAIHLVPEGPALPCICEAAK